MDATVSLAKDWGGSPLQILAMDFEFVSMFINYLLDYEETHEKAGTVVKQSRAKDNFWDF